MYTQEYKKKLADKISQIKNKSIIINIYKIIKDDNKNIDALKNKNGVFVYFHALQDSTYNKIEQYLKKINPDSDINSEKLEYIPYTNDDFPDQEKLSPKLKYSNKEKNIIKRQRYNKIIAEDQTQDSISLSYSPSPVSEKIKSPKKLPESHIKN